MHQAPHVQSEGDADVQCPQCNGALLCLGCNDRRHRMLEQQRPGGPGGKRRVCT